MVLAKLDSRLQDRHDLPLLRYDALVQLHFAEASPTHLDGVRRYFVGHLDDDYIEALGSAFGNVLRAEDA